mmetsp:Transcript_61326/g.97143  ORF Transcript_61326/g.97143 Transcript_61326/m.97143 type:complete len:96 (+) Transcript_61326:1239-1526(+)
MLSSLEPGRSIHSLKDSNWEMRLLQKDMSTADLHIALATSQRERDLACSHAGMPQMRLLLLCPYSRSNCIWSDPESCHRVRKPGKPDTGWNIRPG